VRDQQTEKPWLSKEAKTGGAGSGEAPTIAGAVSSTTSSSRNSGAAMRQERDQGIMTGDDGTVPVMWCKKSLTEAKHRVDKF
jgi:hypothetical protein